MVRPALIRPTLDFRWTLLMLGALLAAGCGHESPETNPSAADCCSPSAASPSSPGGAEMVLVPAGEFLMGSKASVDTSPLHKVSVSAFAMDKCEVTQELYQRLVGKNPSRHKDPKNPVEQVRWREAAAFCNKRSEAEGLKPCYDAKTWVCDFAADGYRLPTEAEWEYACRGGSMGEYYFGDDPADLKGYAWFKASANRATHEVGQLRPNPLGLFNMVGNVAEWCNDWYQPDYYAQSPAADPTGPAGGKKKVVRGGGFKSTPEDCTAPPATATNRASATPAWPRTTTASAACGGRGAVGSRQRAVMEEPLAAKQPVARTGRGTHNTPVRASELDSRKVFEESCVWRMP